MVAERTSDQDRCDLFSREAQPGFEGWGWERGKLDAAACGIVAVVATRLTFSPCRIWLSAGAARGIRTPDPIITNDVLYQLSYCGARNPA